MSMRILIAFFNILMISSAFGQAISADRISTNAVRRLTVDEAVSLAQSGNFDVRIASAGRDMAGGDLVKSGSIFLPRITLSETFISTNDPLTVFGLKLKQSSVTPSDFNPVLLNDPPAFQNFSTRAEIRQPIFNLDGFFGRHAAARASDAAEYTLQRTQNGAVLQAKLSYFGLVLARQSRSVITKALETATAYRTQAKDFFDQGLIQKSEYLMAGVRVLDLESKGIETDNTIRDSENSLRHILGLSDTIHIEPTDSLAPAVIGDFSFQPEQVYHDRSDMMAMQAGVDATSAMVKMYRSKLLPSVNAFGSYELNNNALRGTKGRNWMVGAMVKWDIFTGLDQIGEIENASAKHRQMEAEYDRMKSSAAKELSSSMLALESAQKRITLADASVAQAEEQFRILSDRYARGLERMTDLLQSEASLSAARLQRLAILYQYTSSVATLEFLLERKITQ